MMQTAYLLKLAPNQTSMGLPMKRKLRAYVDLTRLHFFFVWPTLFCSGLFLAFQFYDGFSFPSVIRAALIGFFGFEAGLVLNDMVDAEVDKKDVEYDKLTKYWRPFGKRPLSQGLVSKKSAFFLFGLFVALTTILISTLPLPNAIYVLMIMVVCYCLEVFYQVKKRHENFPFAQLIGRIDFTLFPIAGYLTLGNPDINVLLFAAFFYPLAMAHLGLNDLIDVANDRAKGLNTVPTLYGMTRTAYWIIFFSIVHFMTAVIFLTVLGPIALIGFAFSISLLTIGNYLVLKGKSAAAGLKALPLFHVAMLIYAVAIILDFIA
jgi:4-hydroxybenzoate polyprenyltransferase